MRQQMQRLPGRWAARLGLLAIGLALAVISDIALAHARPAVTLLFVVVAAVTLLMWGVLCGGRRLRLPASHDRAVEVLAENTHDAIVMIQNRLIVYCNTQLQDLTGYSDAELAGQNVLMLVTPSQRDVLSTRYESRQRGEDEPTHYETQLQHRDGSTIPVDMRVGEITYQGQTTQIVLLRDLSAHRQAEAALQVSEARSAAMLSALPDQMFRLNCDGEYLDVGIRAVDGVETASGAADRVPPVRVGQLVQDVLPPAPTGQMLGALHRTLDTGEMQVIEYDVPSAHGPRTFEARLVVSGENEVICIVRDMTDRKRAERERERLIGDLDAFAQTVAHDLKTPLTSILGYAEMLTDDFDTLPPDEKNHFLWIINHESHKMDRIIHELLLFASVREQRHVPRRSLNMSLIVTGALGRMSYLITERDAEIDTPDDGWPIVKGYAPWVEEVWVNYLSNALKYGGSPPQIVLGATEQPDRMIRFWVRDSGPGIATDNQQRIFEQFTRLDEMRASGYGMGLWIVRRIVEKLGGSVGVESIPGVGSTFYFTLPRM